MYVQLVVEWVSDNLSNDRACMPCEEPIRSIQRHKRRGVASGARPAPTHIFGSATMGLPGFDR